MIATGIIRAQLMRLSQTMLTRHIVAAPSEIIMPDRHTEQLPIRHIRAEARATTHTMSAREIIQTGRIPIVSRGTTVIIHMKAPRAMNSMNTMAGIALIVITIISAKLRRNPYMAAAVLGTALAIGIVTTAIATIAMRQPENQMAAIIQRATTGRNHILIT